MYEAFFRILFPKMLDFAISDGNNVTGLLKEASELQKQFSLLPNCQINSAYEHLFNHIHYVKWESVYLTDMNQLEEHHPQQIYCLSFY